MFEITSFRTLLPSTFCLQQRTNTAKGSKNGWEGCARGCPVLLAADLTVANYNLVKCLEVCEICDFKRMECLRVALPTLSGHGVYQNVCKLNAWHFFTSVSISMKWINKRQIFYAKIHTVPVHRLSRRIFASVASFVCCFHSMVQKLDKLSWSLHVKNTCAMERQQKAMAKKQWKKRRSCSHYLQVLQAFRAVWSTFRFASWFERPQHFFPLR